MPSGVIFIICIPSSNYEHILRFGKPKSTLPIQNGELKRCHLAVELRNKKPPGIPIQLTQTYYNEAFNPALEHIDDNDEYITMERILQELLTKLRVEHVVWSSDKLGNYYEVIFPSPTGDRCETMLHCLTQLGIGVRNKSIVRNVGKSRRSSAASETNTNNNQNEKEYQKKDLDSTYVEGDKVDYSGRFNFHNLGYQEDSTNLYGVDDEREIVKGVPTIEPSSNCTVDVKPASLHLASKSFHV